jgi:hypothetical protein
MTLAQSASPSALAIFGIKYVGRKHAEHLLNALKALYSVT